MKQKLLWKIQSLWEQYYQLQKVNILDVSTNYYEGISNYYPRFHEVKEFSFDVSEKLVFTDNYGAYFGLKIYQVLQKDGKPWYLFDNHNEIIYPFVEMYEQNKKALTVVHIDAHRDDAFVEG